MKIKQNNAKQKISAYIHIPFCEHICYYCDFNKVFLEGQPVDEYVDMLLREIELTVKSVPSNKMETVYIGGGTPTSLSAKQLDNLFKGLHEILDINPKHEFTVEANPGDLSADKLKVMENYGVNRLSMGVQSFDNRLLKKIGRSHTAEDVYETMKIIEKSNINNVTIDLIYALPGQTKMMFTDTLEQALALDLPHYSLYSLILENQTVFANFARKGRLELPDDDIEVGMFELAKEHLEKNGRMQYEVSNFSLKGMESQHNLMYWNNEHYYGFGAGASGYVNNQRYSNHGPIQHYLRPLRKKELPIRESEELTITNQMEEHLFLGLRKMEGVSFLSFKERFGVELLEVFSEQVDSLTKRGLLEQSDTGISMTLEGQLWGNDVFQSFLLE